MLQNIHVKVGTVG